MPDLTRPPDGAIGAIAAQWTAGGALKEPEKAIRDTNALLVLHRSAVLRLENGTLKLDDDWVRSWARASRLGQDTPDALALHVAARRRAALRALRADGRTSVVTVIAKPMGAVVTGTGAGGIRNVGIELHGTYGWPVLPGTTLKGAAHSFARDEAGTAPETMAAVFGAPPTDHEPARAGRVTFLDTLPGPGVKVAEHVLAPHTRGYRIDAGDADGEPDGDAGEGPKPPAEYINPVPIPFLVLTEGDFCIHLIGPQPEVTQAAELLKDALQETGLGAKATSGYGYFEVEGIAQGEAQ
jgi:CRISPR-associated protein Cmr6